MFNLCLSDGKTVEKGDKSKIYFWVFCVFLFLCLNFSSCSSSLFLDFCVEIIIFMFECSLFLEDARMRELALFLQKNKIFLGSFFFLFIIYFFINKFEKKKDFLSWTITAKQPITWGRVYPVKNNFYLLFCQLIEE